MNRHNLILNELAELLRDLEQGLLRLKATKDPGGRMLLLRKMSRLLSEIDRLPNAPKLVTSHQSVVGQFPNRKARTNTAFIELNQEQSRSCRSEGDLSNSRTLGKFFTFNRLSC